MEIGTVAVFPEAARPRKLVATPGSETGENVTEPSMAEVAVAACVASSAPWVQTVCGSQDGDHA